MTSMNTDSFSQVASLTSNKEENNFAFVDMQNLYQAVSSSNWKIDWKKFRAYLAQSLHVTKAIIFLGYIKEQSGLYKHLRKSGFVLEFREVRVLADGTVDGGNVDADLAACVMDYKAEYDKAVIIADDADYTNTLKRLSIQNKLKVLLSSHSFTKTSLLIKKSINNNLIQSIYTIKNQIEFKQSA